VKLSGNISVSKIILSIYSGFDKEQKKWTRIIHF
jgi:hypothetical protein